MVNSTETSVTSLTVEQQDAAAAQATRARVEALIHEYNDNVEQRRHSTSARVAERVERRNTKIMAEIAASGREVSMLGTGRIALVLTDAEQAADDAKVREFVSAQRDRMLRETVERYQVRLEQMMAYCKQELATLAQGDLARLDDSQWNSSASLDLPRLCTKIRTMAEDRAAYMEGRFF